MSKWKSRKIIFAGLSGLNTLFLKHYQNRLRVLAYHTIPDKLLFEKQLRFLKQNFSIINLEVLKDHLIKKVELPPNPLLITFDDGDFSVYDNGLPLFKKYKLSSVLFIVTELVNTNRSFWWDRALLYYKSRGHSEEVALEKLKYLKTLPDLERIRKLSGMPELFNRQLNLEELKLLEESGMAICNHSHTHPLLNKCSTEIIEEELEISRKKLFDWGMNGDIFAYPNGNFDPRVERFLKEKNFSLAFLFDHKVNESKIHPLRISRIKVDSDTELNEFKVKVSGLHPFLFKKFF